MREDHHDYIPPLPQLRLAPILNDFDNGLKGEKI